MRHILRDFEDTRKPGAVLARAGLPHRWHRSVPFVGLLDPEPEIADPNDVLLFGSSTLWRHAERYGLRPGVFRIRPFLHEAPWRAYMLNGPGALIAPLRALPERSEGEERAWFLRPVSDSKEVAGRVMMASKIAALARQVRALAPEELIGGSLAPDTEMMLTPPARILKEWRIWVVADEVVAWSLHVQGRRVVYRTAIDDDALAFARDLVAANPGHAPVYVMDICRTPDGLRLLDSNCLNAAGFSAADLSRLVAALETLPPTTPPGDGGSGSGRSG